MDQKDTGESKGAVRAADTAQFGFTRVVLSWRRWWRESVLWTVDQPAVISSRREECELTARYLFMTAMSGGIAILGLLLSSPAVVIGAMLLSPLMGPIMGLGFALAIGDFRWIKESGRSLAWGTLIAVALCALVVFFSPLQTVTPEIASRTRPNLFDLMVALFSALAGAYAMIRGREGTIVGVAIATALMPPLAVVGFGLATFNWTVFSGALLLYVTNLVTIALTAMGMARLYGFRTALSERQTQLQNFVVIAVFVALAVPLGLTLKQIADEARITRQVRGELEEIFGQSARLSQPEINFDTDPVRVMAFVWTTRLQQDAETRAEKSLQRSTGREIDFDLKQFLVRDERSAEEAQLAQAAEREEQAASVRVRSLADRLKLAAGVEDEDILIDRQRRRALVRAKPLEGATLATYKQLEERITATEPGWRIELIPPPPAADLPNVAFEDGEPTENGVKVVNLAAWASQRLDATITVSGPPADAAKVVKMLSERGAMPATTVSQPGPVRLEWADR
jgi:uncharacterized hydrophobic protein (TIGR00271 family)